MGRLTRILPAALLAAVLTLTLNACAIRLISSYDETIDKTVSDFDEEFLRFVSDMQKPGADTSFEKNTAFYDKWKPKIKVLGERAIAASPSSTCPGTQTLGGALAKTTPTIDAVLAKWAEVSARIQQTIQQIPAQPAQGNAAAQPPPMPVSVKTALVNLSGDCTAQLLQMLYAQLEDLGAYHQAMKKSPFDANTTAARDLMEISIRAVMYTELAKKMS